ncbi:hypothetical protein HMN09_00345400 [Mycena chlorophos]|uniref:Uncharacterized protein n=1 Tax=Mycena chlorophos TaxID=658473 RepID=A0A8H6TJC7_MYCCL|nr:hypothetical protein HMN09_00345400 [Mycena chlorophos]
MSTSSSSQLPAELWLYIQALATADYSPVVLANAEWFQYQPPVDPFSQIRHFWRDARSFSLVNTHWNALATDLLYSCVSIDGNEQHFDRLLEILRRGSEYTVANRVRAIRLSSRRFDWNRTILALCSASVQVVLLPDVERFPDLRAVVMNVPKEPLEGAGVFAALTHIFWTETQTSAGLLGRLLSAAPNLRGMYLTDSGTALERGTDPIANLPSALPSLRNLTLGTLDRLSLQSILAVDCFRRITTLTCHPNWLTLLPTLPALHTLRLFGSRTTIDFRVLFEICPVVEEISLDVWNRFVRPDPQTMKPGHELQLIRLHSAVTVVRDWSNIQEFFGMLVAPGFPVVQRVVLHNAWYRVIHDLNFGPVREMLSGSPSEVRIEFPEGSLL